MSFWSEDAWPSIFRSRLGKLEDEALSDVLAGIEWDALRSFVRSLPPSWRLALVRLWSSALLTSSRTGRGHRPCLFCFHDGADRFPHFVRCAAVRRLASETFRSDMEAWSLVRLLGFMSRELIAVAPAVFLALLYQKARHCEDLTLARKHAAELLIRPLSYSDRLLLRLPMRGAAAGDV